VTAEPHPAYPALRDPRQAAAADLRADEDIGALLEHAASRVAAALGVDLAAVFVNAGAGRRMLLRAGSGWDPGSVGTATVSGARGAPVGQALTADDAVVFTDLASAGLPVRPSRLLHEHGVISGLQVAIWGPERPWGVLAAYARRTRAFSPDDADFLRVIANTLALALDRARLDERLGRAESSVGEACREAERRTRAQITELLHDEALQSLLAARQQLGRPDRHEGVTQARASVERAIVELRGAVGALHPVAIERQRLRAAIQAVVGHQARAGGFAAVFALEVEPGEDCAPLLLSVIRELTANVAQHAAAREVGVVLRADGEDLVLEVFDDGVGIPPGRLDAALAEGHIGLASMARRVQALDGRLDVLGRTPGTLVRVTLPGRVAAAGGAGTGCRGEASV
jgi:signal transduction histidine kinase